MIIGGKMNKHHIFKFVIALVTLFGIIFLIYQPIKIEQNERYNVNVKPCAYC